MGHPAFLVEGSLFRDGEGDFQGAEFARGGVEDADAEEELAGGQVELLGELVRALDELPVLGRGERHLDGLAEAGDPGSTLMPE